jgi:hypothetical protein
MSQPADEVMLEETLLRHPDYKIFCDESCHLEHDRSKVMVLGALRCRYSEVERIIRAIKELRQTHKYHTEVKWTKLVARQLPFYHGLIDLFLNESALQFKATVVQNKHLLDHHQYNAGSHNTFYYKMAYYALRDFLAPNEYYRIYLDYMDTLGATKATKLAEVLNNGTKGTVKVETYVIRSYESQLIQLCDLLIGAISYANRDDIPKTSIIKTQIVTYLEEKLCRSLQLGTPPWEEKFNLFMFSPRGKKC